MFFGEPCRETPKDDANNFFKNSQITTQFYVQKKKSQNATQIIEIIKKRNKISLNGRSLTSFSDWCKHCNMLDMWFFFSFCFSAQWLLFFWACYFFSFPPFLLPWGQPHCNLLPLSLYRYTRFWSWGQKHCYPVKTCVATLSALSKLQPYFLI